MKTSSASAEWLSSTKAVKQPSAFEKTEKAGIVTRQSAMERVGSSDPILHEPESDCMVDQVLRRLFNCYRKSNIKTTETTIQEND